jgi:hypothetical protein
MWECRYRSIILCLGTMCRRTVSFTPRLIYPWRKSPSPVGYEAGWAPEFLGRPASSSSLRRLSYARTRLGLYSNYMTSQLSYNASLQWPLRAHHIWYITLFNGSVRIKETNASSRLVTIFYMKCYYSAIERMSRTRIFPVALQRNVIQLLLLRVCLSVHFSVHSSLLCPAHSNISYWKCESLNIIQSF